MPDHAHHDQTALSTELFVYGTLRHDQPEHARFCQGVTGWRPARIRARLWLLPAGYRIATVARDAVLMPASANAVVDEARRRTLAPATITATASALLADTAAPWLAGEVLSFAHAAEAWPPLDRWEEFTPGRPGFYQRAVVPVHLAGPEDAPQRVIAAWAYVALDVPPGALPVASE